MYLMRYCLNSGLAIFWPSCAAQEDMMDVGEGGGRSGEMCL